MLRLYITFWDHGLPEIDEDRLSSYRAGKLRHLKNEDARRQSYCAELLLRFAMNDCGFPVIAPLDIETGQYGKPYLKSGECRFSLSHSDRAVLCAVDNAECGADVQMIRPVNKALVERYYTPEEREYLYSADDPDEAFTKIWAMKESCVKASGLGLATPLSSFSVLDPKKMLHMWHTRIGHYILAVYSRDSLPGEIRLMQVETSALLI